MHRNLTFVAFITGCLSLSTMLFAQDIPIQDKDDAPTLIHRFENPVSPGPVSDIMRREMFNLNVENRQAYAIRICSDRKLLLAFPSAVADPRLIVGRIRSRYTRQGDEPPIYILRSAECLHHDSSSNMFAIEVWGIGRDFQLPSHDERYRFEAIRVEQLGFDPSICSTRRVDYRTATNRLIRKMRQEKDSFGVVIGYRDNGDVAPILGKRLGNIEKMMQRSGLPKDRYIISTEVWHADDSKCVLDPVTRPAIFFLSRKMESRKK